TADSGRVTIAMPGNVSSFLDTSRAQLTRVTQQSNERLGREPLGTKRRIEAKLPQLAFTYIRYRVFQLLPSLAETCRHEYPEGRDLLRSHQRGRERCQTNHRAVDLGWRPKCARGYRKQLFHSVYRFDAH